MPFPRRSRVAVASACFAALLCAHAQIGDPHLKKEWAACLGPNPAAAIKACKAILDSRLEPPANQAIAHNYRSLAYASRGEIAPALADIDEAIRINPTFAPAYSNRGNLRAANHEYDQAIADYNHALSLAPQPNFDPANTLDNRATVYNSQGDYDKALTDENEVVRLRPTDPQAFFHRGNIQANKGDATQALADYDRSLALAPNNPTVTEARDRITHRSATTTTAAALPPCAVPPNPPPSYGEDTVDHLKREVPDLRGIDSQSLDATETTHLVQQTAEAIAVMLPKIPNLVAREDVIRTPDAQTLNGNLPSSGRTGRPNRNGGGGVLETTPDDVTTTYTYRIVHRSDRAGNQDLDEFRTDRNNRPLTKAAEARNAGFGSVWLLFAPANLPESHFRYLGHQKLSGHETFALAFVQLPNTHLGTEVGPIQSRCNTYIQGVAWIDRESFHIVRMQTDLVTPLPALPLLKLRSVLKYTEVKIPERALSLWLPQDVEISWNQDGRSDKERHLYSKYRLFTGTARLLPTTEGSPDPPKP